MRTVAGPCLQSCTSKLQAAGPSCPDEPTESCGSPLTRNHPLHADCGLGTRGLIIAAPYLHFAQLQSKSTSEKEILKHGEKHSFSDGKCFTDFVLPRCFIDFQTTRHFG